MSRRSAQTLYRWLRVMSLGATAAGLGSAFLHGGCLVTEYCYSEADCDAPKVCIADGTCVYECNVDGDCEPGMRCVSQRCEAKPAAQPIVCPDDMASVANAFCVDRYEASRSDATESSKGTAQELATSRAGVMPWQLVAPEDNGTARAACLAAGKDLCSPQQWRAACQGSRGTAYAYGDVYEPATCNGIHTFGLDGFHLLPTGSLPMCKNDWGAFDMNGNLWEHTLGGSNRTVRGGAYNCKDSQTLHRCDYVPGDWDPSARGFRCCLLPEAGAPDAGVPDAAIPDAQLVDGSSDGEGGCLDEDAADVSVDAPWDVATDVVDAPDDAVSEQGADAPGDAQESGAEGCPPDMVRSGNACMDPYEASRSDATASTQGTIPIASSREGVLPWFPVDLATARAACASAGKRLCRLDEWVEACEGPSGTVYSYGNDYEPATCNGIDTYCDCNAAACGTLATCPYPHCFNQASPEGGGPCGSMFHVEPTGSFQDCRSADGLYDVNGNVWELTDTTDGLEHFRGGAYNCSDSEALHRCDHDGTWGPSARGFRCCKDPE